MPPCPGQHKDTVLNDDGSARGARQARLILFVAVLLRRVCLRYGKVRYTADREPCEHKIRTQKFPTTEWGCRRSGSTAAGKQLPNAEYNTVPVSSETSSCMIHDKREKEPQVQVIEASPGRSPRSSNHPRAE